MAVAWSDEDDSVIAGDLAAALVYVTPAGDAVVTPVDRAAAIGDERTPG